MERRHPAVLAICVVALGLAIAAAARVSGAAQSSGKPALTVAAREVEALLKDPRTRDSDFEDRLAPGSSVRDAGVRTILSTLKQDFRLDSALAKVETVRGERGTTTFLVSEGVHRPPSTRTIEWLRGTDGRWRIDVLGTER